MATKSGSPREWLNPGKTLFYLVTVLEESEVEIDSSKSEGGDKPPTVWERLFGFLLTWNLITSLTIWLIFVLGVLVLGFLLIILIF